MKYLMQQQKTELLEQAVVNKSPEEVNSLLKELGYMEMTARALGIACRYVGMDMVKALVEGGAKFSFPRREEIEREYHCFADVKFLGWLTNYALMILDIFRGDLHGVSSIKGLSLFKQIPREKGKLPVLPREERLGIVKYLYENREKVDFDFEELLFISYFVKADEFIGVLKELGAELSQKRRDILTGKTEKDESWFFFCHLVYLLKAEDTVEVLGNISKECAGEKLCCTEHFYEYNHTKLYEPDVFEFFTENFDLSKMNKTQIMKAVILEDRAGCLPAVEKSGWLKLPKKRDEMIAFAAENGCTESAAWLLDFKNRTADFAAEQVKAEKKMMRELNAKPDSVTELKKIWSYKKREDGTLIITNYKGLKTEVIVPDKIGKSEVTAIGNGAFAGMSGVCGGEVTTYATQEQQKARREITKLVLPSGLKSIGVGAFAELRALESIEIPEGVTEIGKCAFYECISLKSVTVPGGVKSIGGYCFSR
ncbi:MAG: leucine-rich repeat domain-containing protein, partial [Oscillospiraceae bacterium]|nr:leucine-rich repeat domain-containing protein [Oscillospiraceae bacterium]